MNVVCNGQHGLFPATLSCHGFGEAKVLIPYVSVVCKCCLGEEPWLPAYIPNVMYSDSQSAVAAHSGAGQLVIKGLAFVAIRHIQNEEILLNYRLNPQVLKPAWYAPVDVEEDKRRWY